MKFPIGAKPGKVEVSQERSNDRLLDSVRNMFGRKRYDPVEFIQPVVLADADAPVPLQYKGCAWYNSALNAGFRSEISVSNNGGLESLAKVWVTIVSAASAPVIRIGVTLAGYTNQAGPYTDLRFMKDGVIPTLAAVVISTKNTAAANATGTIDGQNIAGGLGAALIIPEIGPFWLPGNVSSASNKHLLVQAGADAQALSAQIRWEWYAPVR